MLQFTWREEELFHRRRQLDADFFFEVTELIDLCHAPLSVPLFMLADIPLQLTAHLVGWIAKRRLDLLQNSKALR